MKDEGVFVWERLQRAAHLASWPPRSKSQLVSSIIVTGENCLRTSPERPPKRVANFPCWESLPCTLDCRRYGPYGRTSDPSLAFQIQLAMSTLLEYLADKWSLKYVKLSLSYHPASLGTGFSSTLPGAGHPATWFPQIETMILSLAIPSPSAPPSKLASHQILSLLPLVRHQSTHFPPSHHQV